MDDEIEAGRGEHPQIVHRGLDDLQVEPPLGRHLPVEGEHRRGEIDDGHPCSGGCIEGAMLAATGRQAEELEAIEPRREPRPPRRPAAPQPAAWIVERLVDGRAGEGRLRGR